MLAKVIIENGVKKIQALTADTGTGNPVGTIIPFYGNTAPSGYLTCDGSQFDENTYPVLYALLGNNHTPDLRECTLKMVGENPNGASHVKSGGLAVGEFIDDRIKSHNHELSGSDYPFVNGAYSGVSGWKVTSDGSISNGGATLYMETQSVGGATTEVKAVGVNFCIKATSGLTENQQENVLNTINENNSYSTEEHPTGKKWIDGKPIYSKVIKVASISSGTTNVNHGADIDKLISYNGYCEIYGGKRPFPFIDDGGYSARIAIYTSTYITVSTSYDMSNTEIVLEYTKTTDN